MIIVYNKNSMPICGTKGWVIFCKAMMITKYVNTIYFIDDSMKNIECVENVNNNNIRTYFINKKDNKYSPKQQLDYILNKIDKKN